jgi:hypothetical protein
METTQMRTAVLALVVLAAVLTGHAARAQTVIAPGASVSVAWDAPVGTHAGTMPTGYRFETFTETATGVVITTTDVPATKTEATLPSSVLPAAGSFFLAVRAFNDLGVSGRSNALPFARAGVPAAPANLRVVP